MASRRLLAKVYTSHTLSAWGDRMWTFAIGLFLVQLAPESLRLTAIYGIVVSCTILFFCSTTGDWVDRSPRLRALCTEKPDISPFVLYAEMMKYRMKELKTRRFIAVIISRLVSSWILRSCRVRLDRRQRTGGDDEVRWSDVTRVSKDVEDDPELFMRLFSSYPARLKAVRDTRMRWKRKWAEWRSLSRLEGERQPFAPEAKMSRDKKGWSIPVSVQSSWVRSCVSMSHGSGLGGMEGRRLCGVMKTGRSGQRHLFKRHLSMSMKTEDMDHRHLWTVLKTEIPMNAISGELQGQELQ
ncbi:unnamed protein product, partial [Darwinula stevensoni]